MTGDQALLFAILGLTLVGFMWRRLRYDVIALSSGFINNVGALALFMPVAVWMARHAERSPSFLLMPLAFGSLLGGTLTLIGTPPNIIIAAYRADTGAEAFGMFDFLPVGLAITFVGVTFIALIGWRQRTVCDRKPPDRAARSRIECLRGAEGA